MPESRERKYQLLVLDARARMSRFSKARMLCAIAGIALAAVVVAPTHALAAEQQPASVPEEPAIEQVVAGADGQAMPEQVAPANTAGTGEAAAPTQAASQQDEAAAVAEQIPTPAEPVQTQPVDQTTAGAAGVAGKQEVVSPSDGQVTADKAAATADATDQRAASGTGTSAAANATGDAKAATDAKAQDQPASQKAALRKAAVDALSKAIKFDKAGTTIYLDFDGDGKTTDADWSAYRDWVKTYRVFDFSGDFSSGWNGGLQVTGGSQLVLNGHDKGPKDLNIGIDVDKIKSYYLNNIGQATSVKNQSPYGSCWAFGATSALESAILKAMAGDKAMAYNPADHKSPKLTGIEDKVDLSELELAWLCYSMQPDGDYIKDTLPGDTDADRLSCGGWGAMAETMYSAWQAICNESDDPYWPQGVPKTFENFKKLGSFVWKLRSGKKTAIAHVKGVNYLPDPAILQLDKKEHMVYKGLNKNAIKLIKEALVKYGAVSIGYQADTALPGKPSDAGYFNSTYWAQYCDAVDDITDTHAVSIVGWDDNFDHNKFKAEKNDVSNLPNGAWLVKNSWGSYDWLKKNFPDVRVEDAGKAGNWGITDAEGNHTGYFWLSYYDHSIVTPSYFEVDLASDGFDYDNNYSYDYLINESQIPFVLRTKDTGTEVANVFTAKGREDLRAVSVHTFASNSRVHVRVFLVDDDDLRGNDPTTGTCVSDFFSDQLVTGYHTVNLPQAIKLKKGQKFAVVENIVSDDTTDGVENPGKVSYIALETGMSADAQTDDNMGYLFSHANANPGTTFVRILTEDGYKWMTPQELAANYCDGHVFEFGNAMVKAFTTNATDGEVTPESKGSAGAAAKSDVQTTPQTARASVALPAVYQAKGESGAKAHVLPKTGDTNDQAATTALFAAALAIVGAGAALRDRKSE